MQKREKAIPLQPLSGERAQVTENDMLKNSVLDPASDCASILPWYCPRERESHPSGFPEKKLFRKNFRKVWQNEKKHLPLHPLSDKNGSRKEERSLIDFR